MSGRLIRKILREQELKSEVISDNFEVEDSADSPLSSPPFRNPFDLLDDQVVCSLFVTQFLAFLRLEEYCSLLSGNLKNHGRT